VSDFSAIQVQNCWKDGTEFPVEISLCTVTTGKKTFVISGVRDLSERRLAEAQIKKLNDKLEKTLLRMRTQQAATARLSAIFEGSEDAIIALSLDGVITDWNQAATRLYGYSAEEAIGRESP
jgi:PAS domain-containing protein